MLFSSYLPGTAVAISAILTVFPELFLSEWKAIHTGNIMERKAIHFRLLPVWQLLISAGIALDFLNKNSFRYPYDRLVENIFNL